MALPQPLAGRHGHPPGSMAQRLGLRFRSARDRLLRDVIERAHPGTGGMTILDLGGRQDYWRRVGFAFLADRGISVTLHNLSEAEFKAAPDAPEGLFGFALGDGCRVEFPDGAFDLCHSNSVIEHVGLWGDMIDFARETRRVGRAYYVQTPSFWFPVDPHFWRVPMNHWLPRPMRAELMQALPLATAGRARDVVEAYRFVDSSLLLTRGQMRALFPEAELHAERVALLAKSWTATYVPSERGNLRADAGR
jgi:hypothetical protein